jgi:cytochrome oxidase Cu insertion factor (SCO1/SenC/PrrC family)
MWKKALIRVALVMLVVAGGMLVFAASHTAKTLKSECKAAGQDDDNKAGGEFIIFESLSRTVLANVH